MTSPLARDGVLADGEANALAERYRAVFHGACTGMYLVDAEGRLVDSNRAFSELLGYAPDELRGADLARVLDPEDLPAAQAGVRDLVSGRRDRYHAERTYRSKDGRLRQMVVHASALRDAAGGFRFGLAEVEDVSEKRALEAQLLFADRMSALGTLAAGVAHEINNPLAFILSNLAYAIEELQRTGAAAEVLRALDEAREGSVRVREIVRDLKTFSRAEDRPDEAVDVRAVIQSAMNLALNEIRHRARLEHDLRPVPPVMGSAHRLGQVFLNLLINSAQAIPEGRADRNLIRVTCREEGGRVLVEVADTGCGIASEHLPRIFEPFFTTKPVGVGTGLGLSVCHGIIVALGGEIAVESRPGATTFRVALPSAVAGAEPAASEPGVRGRRGRVLIVDDEPMVARALARTLATHEVAVVHGGSDALDRLRHDAGYDVIVCDLLMPDVDGMELYERLRVEWPGLCDRIVFMTGGAPTERVRAFLESVGNPRLQKPFEPAGLRALVDALLAARG